MDSKWDLIVAGAGPAGCVLAAKVARGGARVLLLESKQEPGLGRDWIVDVGRDTFKLAGVPSPLEAELFEEPEQTVLVTSDRANSVDLFPAPMVPVRNGPYVRRLAAWARDCGAELRTGVVVGGPVVEGDAVRGLRLRDGSSDTEQSALVVADCTGLRGSVRRGTPPHWGVADEVHREDIVLARRETWSIDADAARAAMKRRLMWDGIRYDRVGTQGVYSVETFFVDLDKGFIDILIGVKPGSGPNPEERFESIRAQYPFITEKVFGDGGPIPIRRPLDTFAANGLVCVGDSACQVIPAHGSGTASAILAADIAASVVLRAIETGRADRAALWGYCHAFQARRGALLAYYDVIRQHTATLTVEDLNMFIEKGMVGASEIYSGLVPEVPRIGVREIWTKARGGLIPLPLLLGFARAGILAGRTMKHYRDYPPLDIPGALKRWILSMPGRS